MVRVRVRKTRLKSIYARLDNGVVRNGVLTSPDYGYSVQRKFGFFSRWSHWYWTKKDHSHLDFLITE